jgi:VanZ family protein
MRRMINNLLHVPAYGVLALLWIAVAWAYSRQRHSLRGLLIGTGCAAGFGVLTEAAQRWVPGRVASAGDLLLNCAGVGAAAILLWACRGLIGTVIRSGPGWHDDSRAHGGLRPEDLPSADPKGNHAEP